MTRAFVAGLLLASCAHAPRATTRGPIATRAGAPTGDPDAMIRDEKQRYGVFEDALRAGDVRRVRGAFATSLLESQSTAETAALVNGVHWPDGDPVRWVLPCVQPLPGEDGVCGKSPHDAAYLMRDDGVVLVDLDERGWIVGFRRRALSCVAHTGCWTVWVER